MMHKSILSMKHLSKRLIEKLWQRDRLEYLVLLFIIIYTVVFSYYTILRHYAFDSSAWDLGGYEQALWSTVNYGKFFWGTIDLSWNPGGSFFGVHFSPILFLILPIYAVHQTPETLLVLQSFFLALGALPIYWLARDQIDKRSALVFAAAYLLYPPLHGVNWFDFHVQAFLPAFFLFAFYYYSKGKWFRYLTFIMLALMVNEFVPFIVVFMGLYGLWVSRKDFIKILRSGTKGVLTNKITFYSLITIILGLFWFILAVKVVDYFNPSRPPLTTFQFSRPIYGLLDLIPAVLSDPMYVIQTIFTPEKFIYIAELFLPIAALSLFDPPSLLISTPWLMMGFLSRFEPYYTAVGYQYPGFIIPFIFISAVFGFRRLMLANRPIDWDRSREKTFLALIMTFSLFSCIALSPLGGGLSYQESQATLHNEMLMRIINLVPQNASIATQAEIFPHVSQRLYAYPYPMADVEYVLVDTRSSFYKTFRPPPGFFNPSSPPPGSLPSFSEWADESVKNDGYGLFAAADGIFLFKKDYYGKPLLTSFSSPYGLWAKFYATPQFFTDQQRETIGKMIVLSIDWNWGTSSPLPSLITEDKYGIEFEGYLSIPTSGNYTFKLWSDDSSNLYLDGKVVIDGLWGLGFGEESATIYLEKGFHKLTINYANFVVSGSIRLYWATPWNKMEIIPYEFLCTQPPSP